MKRISLMLIAVMLAAVLVLNNCGGGSSPSSAFNSAINAAKRGDLKTFSKYIVGGDEFYNEYKKATGDQKDLAKGITQGMIGGLADTKFKIVGEEINGDQATLKIEIEDMGMSAPQTFSMQKENGVWKLDLGNY